MTAYAEQRKHERVAVDVTVYWGLTPACAREGRVSSLSLGGCFLATGENVPVGEEVFVNLRPRAGRPLLGEVRYQFDGSGLGVAFKELDPPAAELLGSMVGSYSGNQ
jgi:hypothetical protein